MTKDIMLFVLFLAVLLLCAWPLGKYMARVFNYEKTCGERFFAPLENIFYKMAKVDPRTEMPWKEYCLNLIIFNALGMLSLFVLQLTQAFLPLNPQQLPNVETWHLAFNTAASFMTNTNWQAYSGETTLSYLTQMLGLTVQNFLSAATGAAVAIALIRGLVRKNTGELGNFWADIIRCTTRILLPICVVATLLLVSQGVIQNLNPYVDVQTVEGAQQTIAMGPVASQEAIKELGTNGGGFFNANSSHPFENPTPWSNFLEMFLILVIPTGLLFTFGEMCKDKKQGYAVLASMLLLFVLMLGVCYASEKYGNPIVAAQGISGDTAMEGKEVRFGIGSSSLFATVTTAASCGAVNSMHDRYTGTGGLVPMLQMMLGEVVLGGVGAGFYGMMLYVFITVFIVGLMVGRTPEYLGKKIEAKEVVLTIAGLLIPAATILTMSAVSCLTEAGQAGISNPGPHGLSEILYGFASGVGNNGSAFAGLGANSLWYNVLIGLAMLIGRFAVIVPVLAIAGNMVTKKIAPANAGTFNTGSSLFAVLLAGVVLIVGALTFLPALALGPIVDQLFMLQGKVF